MDGSMQSSPDPLNASQSFQSPQKARRASRVRTSLPHQSSSPKKQTFELDVGNELSPQKIRVTVEAGESDVEDVYVDNNIEDDISPTPGPVPHRRERTTTTTIPVKGLSDSEEEAREVATPKRGRGRPKKSAGTPVPAKKKGARASTPTQKSGRRKSIGDLIDGDDDEDVNFELGKSVEINRGKGRSRSRSRKGNKSTPVVKAYASENGASSAASKKGRGRRKKLLPQEVEVLEDDSGKSISDSGRGSESVEPSGSLAQIDANSQYSGSAYSTIRSTVSIGLDEPDVVIARFDPGNETPRRTGWSSPMIIEAPRPSSSRRRSDNYPSPSLSPDKMTFDQLDKEGIVIREDEDDEEGYEEEGEDGLGELREFDTILESEGFSMISVDSVPSLREHISSPAEPAETGLPPRNKSLVAVQEADAAAYNDSFSEIPDEILAAATPAKKAQNPRLLSVHQTRRNDSFSSVAPEILDAATPARQQSSSKPLCNKVISELRDYSEQPSSKKRLSATRSQWNEDYEDSFSAIPPAILDAATPAAVRQERSASGLSSLPAPRPGQSPSHATSPSGTRLLTPDETPSPPAEESTQDGNEAPKSVSISQHTAREATTHPANESSFISQLPSSPPSMAARRYTYTAHLRQHRQFHPDVTQTPSIVFSSPSLPPPMQPPRGQVTLAPAPEQSERPALSPIARAGRMLQNIVVPSSPRSRSQSLGSPFKSPAAERNSSSSAQLDNQSSLLERRAGPLPKLDLNSHFSRQVSQPQRRNTRLQEDPFRSNDLSYQRSPSPEEKEQYSLGLPQVPRYSDPRHSNLGSGAVSVQSDNDMSWQAEEERLVPVESASTTNYASTSKNTSIVTSESKNPTPEEIWSAERAEVIKQAECAGSDQVIVIDSDSEDLNREDVEEDEGFGQLLETLNSSSPAVPKPREPMKEIAEKPRRSKIPSPWRKNSKRLVYSDELSQLSSPPIGARVALAKNIAKEAISQPVTVRRVESSEMNGEVDADLSGWQIPQKANFKPRPRETSNFDISALLSASPPKRLPVLSRSSQQFSKQQESISSRISLNEPSEQRIAPSVEIQSRQPTGFTPIPQKQGFNPRPRAGSASPVKQPSLTQNLFSGNAEENHSDTPPELLSSSSISRPLSESSPSRTNTLPAYRTPSAQVSPLNSDQDSSLIFNSDKENQVTNSRTLKWTESLRLQSTQTVAQTSLPAPTTSPTKSCLRSPMKTPSANAGSSENTSPSKAVAFVSSSPIPTSPTAPLSSTTWSKDHWRLLDSILQQWKTENQDSSPLSDGSRGKEKRRRNSTRVISRLLGKTVSSQGEKLVLEQWHLEVVDEFRGMVPGWEEKVVAMRVFSLVVGEEKRALREVAQAVKC
ncbi:hypothetical protein EG329_013658 [Mollisiaceae sp. DMI_Dod_QoI]|nr:hypothetical protein EG329_013658 [Helotiales sp. DMI_Dod_QoI]